MLLWVLGSFAILFLLLRQSRDGGIRQTLRRYDYSSGAVFALDSDDARNLSSIVARLQTVSASMNGLSFEKRLNAVRVVMNSFFADIEVTSDRIPVNLDGLPAEWVLARRIDARKRFLYIHGGAFCAGSPNSHRSITSRLSEAIGCAVLAIDYRLMPENSRQDAMLDCRAAYQFLLDNGPDGSNPADAIFIGGDSAGGNLTLSLTAWLRDAGSQMPNAVIALSPLTDSTLDSPSFRNNYRSDVILKTLFRLLNRVPRALYGSFFFLANKISVSNPSVSPLLGDLSKMPPLLIQVSESEMLFDDARRYVNKAREAGSPAYLQRWESMPHVFQIFHPHLRSATLALDEVAKFCQTHSPVRGSLESLTNAGG